MQSSIRWLMGIIATLFVGGTLAWASNTHQAIEDLRERELEHVRTLTRIETLLERMLEVMQREHGERGP